MSFDNSRLLFNPLNDYAGVVMQQGRVLLDSDWNEMRAEIARRIQAGTLDILGLAGVPATTPQAFQIGIVAGPDSVTPWIMTIGTGRIYVDGLLVENHGAGQYQWDPILAEWSGIGQTALLDFRQQPYYAGAALPTFSTIPAPLNSGLFLVYLDVWQRELTYLNDPALVDSALGVDTTARLQTVWQVKLLDVNNVPGGVGPTTSEKAIAQNNLKNTSYWQYLIQGSPSLLTNGLVPSVSTGPCALNPSSGYTGQENQLYRVRIQQGGIAIAAGPTLPITSVPPGTATFQWSRENGSVATLVTAIASGTNSMGNTASKLTVQSLGRDSVLGFNAGDWVEVFDDILELNPGPAGNAQSGELHQIDFLSAADSTITLVDQLVTSANFPVSGQSTVPGAHVRIRRWDGAGKIYLSDGQTVWADLAAVGNSGIPVPPAGTTLILENGITVSFDLVTISDPTLFPPAFLTGDYWSFAARSADGSIEPLNAAPPAGVNHHVCHLATVNFSAPQPSVVDFRRVFPTLTNLSTHVVSTNVGTAQLLNDGLCGIQTMGANGISVQCDAVLDAAALAPPYDPTVSYVLGQTASTVNGAYTYNPPPGSPAAATIAPPAGDWSAGVTSPAVNLSLELPTTALSAGGTTPVNLACSINVSNNTIVCTPIPAASAAVESLLSPAAPASPPAPFLARLKIKGNCIWAVGGPPYVYLNGATLMAPAAAGSGQRTQMLLPSGDERVCADFDMWFWVNSQPQLTLTSSISTTNALTLNTLAFGPQSVGATSTAQTIYATNTGASTLTIQSATVTDNVDNLRFSLTPSPFTAVTLSPLASATFQVTFKPTGPGVTSGTLSIMDDKDGATPITVALSGIGIQSLLTASPPNLNFPAQFVGTPGVILAVALVNNGSAPATIGSISTASSSFILSTGPSLPTTLSPNGSLNVSVQFIPAVVGANADWLTITYHDTLTIGNDLPYNSLTVPLSGTCINPIVKAGKDAKEAEKPFAENILMVPPAHYNVPPAAELNEASQKPFIAAEERPPLK